MRIKQLQLLKYGKFEGHTVDFPRSEFDFHLVVGPNEAGKSTIRSAISELLFGMPQRTPLAFMHPLPELRLGGTLEGEGTETVFHRARGRTQLRTLADIALPDDHLSHLLGSVDKSQFEKMYCLDHEQLVEGGQSILDGSKEVGRVLFQSAAGITKLGPVREALDAQASVLWARRGGSDYAAAAARLEEASVEFKGAQVRTKVWQEAKATLDAVQEEISAEEDARLKLEALRAKLERVRRLGGQLQRLRAKSSELADLGAALELPVTATADLSAGEAELAAAEVMLTERRKTLEDLTTTRLAIKYDERLIALQTDIESLDTMRSTFSNHARDLPLRQAEMQRHILDAQDAAKQIGWPTDEIGMRSRQPTALSLKTVTKLLSSRGAHHAAAKSAEGSVRERTEDLHSYRTDLDTVTGAEVPEALRTALADALTFRDSPAKQRSLSAAENSATASLSLALGELAPCLVEVDALRAMSAPSGTRIQNLVLQRREIRSEVARARESLQKVVTELGHLKLQAQQFERAKKIVTATEVHDARASRDATWDSVKGGATTLDVGAPILDAAIRLADELVDAQLGTATEAATLESLRQGLEAAESSRTIAENVLTEALEKSESFEADVQRVLVSAGLEALPLEEVPDWLAKRDTAIALSEALAQRKRDLDDEIQAVAKSRAAITQPLLSVGLEVAEQDDLATLAARAASYIAAADAARTRRGELGQLVKMAERAVATAQAASDAAAREYEDWKQQWSAALAAAGLATASATFAEAEGAVELANVVASSLKDADELQRSRIDTMRADLAKLEDGARRLASMVAPALLELDDPSAICLQLAKHLRDAVASARRAKDSDDGVQKAKSQVAEAELKVQTTNARIKPLLDQAQAASIADAMPVAARSDLLRRLRAEITEATDTLLRDGDGLSIDGIEAEVTEFAPAEVIALHEKAKADSLAVSERMNVLIQRRVAAEQAFSAIAGQANAAIAEAKRQEALATMSEVAEQYLEVATAGKLLKWAIDRYRDRKQGPMLKRAGAIFSTLTLGAFSNLVVDYEKEIPTLYAKRRGGQVVEVSGLSEGTRDQLFMSLRIAAIELQLETTKPLPFVADDLFINFDDERSKAGLLALRELSKRTQVIFLTHHSHLVPLVHQVFGEDVSMISLERELASGV